MKKKYTIKEAASLFGMSPEALRFYEREGVFRPLRDEENGYRYFDKFTVFRLGNCKRLRSLNFSMQEINLSLKNDTLDSFIPKLKEKQKALAEKIDWDRKVEAFIAEYADTLVNIPAQLDTFRIETSPELLYLLHHEDDSFFSGAKIRTILPQWIDKMPLVRIFSLVPRSSLTDPEKGFIRQGGYAIRRADAESLAVPADTSLVKTIPSRSCIRTILAVENSGPSLSRRFDKALEYMAENSLVLDGDPWGFQLFVTYRRHNDPGGNTGEKEIGTVYYEYFLPIKKNNN
ncbi:MerR family transcriptional regulator [Breznakiella homolactica]|uniref:MerR family transcriptional regulator n=1 Tax=Breznakiella homolactica TaxID=2798577 RepID=A0A7T7XMJ2_9SPIR|nr:MerR family transcriptional regulator [Breznakiella homolactica]QQO09027.1 MerR family transcriptional regulator [Breznakiella homolactica]